MSFYKCKNKDYVSGYYDGERDMILFEDIKDASIARDGVRLLTTVLSEKMEKREWLPSFPNIHDALVHALLTNENFSEYFND